MKKSFTMIELIFVIVVLAIVAGGTFEFILRIYQSYARVKTIDTIQTELDLALTQISTRLSYRVKDSVIASDGSGNYHELNNTIPFYAQTGGDPTMNKIEWISYDRESLMGMWDNTKNAVMPGWSAFSDRKAMFDDGLTSSRLVSLGSNLNYANQIINSLSDGKVSLNTTDTTKNRVALIMPSDDGIMRYGWYDQEGNNSFIVHCNDCITGDDSFTFTLSTNDFDYSGLNNFRFRDRNDTDRYYLAWSAYALERNTTNNDLYLYYNYQPWSNTNPNIYKEGNQSLLLQNINSFDFRQQGNTLWIKICMDSENLDTLDLTSDDTYAFCKERVIY